MSILCLVMLVLCVYILTAIWLFATSSAFFLFWQPCSTVYRNSRE